MAEERQEIGVGSSIGPLAFSGDTLEIGDLLGSGATANVYACRRRATGEQLAVKVIDVRRLAGLENPEQALQRLEVEVQALRGATHERCLGLKDIYRTKRWVCLVMERLQGGELFDQIINRKRLAEPEAKHIFCQVVEGLSFLHSRHIAHRDIKPENILIVGTTQAPGGSSLIDIKIADFGLSKLMDAGSMAKSVVGTPQYWAPEVLAAAGTTAYDQRADLWSLGVTLYVMLRGQYPFKGEGLNEKIRNGQYELSGAIWAQISEEAKDLIRSLLRVNPAERLSLEDCLRHPWIAPSQGPPRTPSASSSKVSSVQCASAAQSPEAAAIVKWEGAGALHVGGDGSGQAFSLKELVQLQVSLVASLELASLMCRQGHAHLTADISKVLHQAHALWQRTLTVVRQYSQVARQVNQQVLPDLELAMQEAEPSLALELLDVVQEWVLGMRKDGDAAQRMCSELGQQLQELIIKAQRELRGDGKASAGMSGYPALPQPAQQQLLGPVASAPPSSSTQPQEAAGRNGIQLPAGGVNTATQELLDGLASFGACYAAGDNQGTESVCSRRSDLIDLLFLAPGVKRPAALKDSSVVSEKSATGVAKCAAEDDMTDAQETPRSTGADVEMQIVPRQQHGLDPMQEAQKPSEELADPLLQALRELRRVSEILLECMSFWTNMAGTVKELSRTKDHTQSLLKYASKTARLRERFNTRLAEYSEFWRYLMRLCDEYCKEVEPALVKIRTLTRKVEDVADTMDGMHAPMSD